jgi:lipopolysaccharide biosynthesis glycosyltransferase
MKTAIFQFLIGPSRGQEYCIKSVINYSKKNNIDYFISQNALINGPHIMFEKYQLFSLFNQGYDRVLYLDADIMITPKAENIFNIYDELNIFYAFDENDNTECMNRDNYIHEKISKIQWPINNKNKKQYFNAGVMIFSKNTFDNFKSAFDLSDIPNWPDIWYFGEQTIVNYWIAKNKIPFKSIDYRFNRMHLGKPDLNNERYKADFIHYAGPCQYGNGNKPETMKMDYNQLYNY